MARPCGAPVEAFGLWPRGAPPRGGAPQPWGGSSGAPPLPPPSLVPPAGSFPAAPPSSEVRTNTAARSLHWATRDGEAAATAAWRGWLRGDAAAAQRDIARPAPRAAQAWLWRAATLVGLARIAT